MPVNAWELRADVRPLELAAQRWTEIGSLLARRGDEVVDAARRATDGWDAGAAESYEDHRRQLVANLDGFTQLAAQISGSLRAVSAVVTSAQEELDRAWADVAMIPHDVVGESRRLVFRPTEDGDRGKVDRGQAATDEIRSRLGLSLDQESARLRTARAELTTLSGGAFPRRLLRGEEESGVGTTTGTPSTGGMGGGAMGVRAGTGSRGTASARSGPRRLTTPTPRSTADDEAIDDLDEHGHSDGETDAEGGALRR